MENFPFVLSLKEIRVGDVEKAGGKGANLGEIIRAGFSVPPGFCVTTAAYRAFLAENGLAETAQKLMERTSPSTVYRLPTTEELQAAHLRERIAAGRWPPTLAEAVREAYREIGGGEVAVRSSATVEDSAESSFAGQGETFLNVRGEEALLEAIVACWVSLWSEQALFYRLSRIRCDAPCKEGMAVVVQEMVPTEVGGVAFSSDPVHPAGEVLIEAGWGLAGAVLAGEIEPDRYRVDRKTLQEKWSIEDGGGEKRTLTPEQVRAVAEATLALERHFGTAVDVEWGFRQGRLYLFQARPQTAREGDFFTNFVLDENSLWTSGFLSERFARPVSPLAWSVIGGWVEELGLADPLRFLGVPEEECRPIARLYRGHPYVNLAVFQSIYKLFPSFLLPEDAARYFPGRDASCRRQARYPRSLLDPKLWLSLFKVFLQDPACWSPWHNDRLWRSFLARFEQEMTEITRLLRKASHPKEAWEIFKRAEALSRRLLAIHRFSLVHADLSYTLLRRLACAWFGEERGGEICAKLAAGLPNKSVELDKALAELAALSPGEKFKAALEKFLAKYGHRSFTLDIYYPHFSAEPSQVHSLLENLRKGRGQDAVQRFAEQSQARKAASSQAEEALRRGPLGFWKRLAFRQVLSLAQRYMLLREDQRFHWQRALAVARQAFLVIGERMAAQKEVAEPQDIFFATKEELAAYVERGERAFLREIPRRRAQFYKLQREYDLAPERAYPPFLKGNRPLESQEKGGERCFQGQPVSPGLAEGPVRVVLSPEEFPKVQEGDILVTRSADPGWTPLFGKLSGLVIERGGQLSHGAILAREYGLPAVAGLSDITRVLQEGEIVLVDGQRGHVLRQPGQS